MQRHRPSSVNNPYAPSSHSPDSYTSDLPPPSLHPDAHAHPHSTHPHHLASMPPPSSESSSSPDTQTGGWQSPVAQAWQGSGSGYSFHSIPPPYQHAYPDTSTSPPPSFSKPAAGGIPSLSPLPMYRYVSRRKPRYEEEPDPDPFVPPDRPPVHMMFVMVLAMLVAMVVRSVLVSALGGFDGAARLKDWGAVQEVKPEE
ncbi:hypothetical protein M427DRAFT_137900 [Gonapodya prolifera JEL478]|uniref:Uncharacterized protein n=1 Tax=Gonapodya prolifera (strain JEL478) TaxID=1344416 RepID=A0A139A5A9_GONPJ|nr:hypothetical protein M427DRAFT_137900 [Gonapodya prolifera JEL478]|eukprot:KXS11828.1 hypothetical protein M427DRAFT_137900 [Gonapodya prolifera JEL478]